MSGGYGYAPPRASAVPVVAAVALVLAAGLAVGGSFGAFYVYSFTSELTPTTTTTRTGWQSVENPVPEGGQTAFAPPLGIPLVVGGALALVAALMLVLMRREGTGPGPGRLVGTTAAGLLLGVVAAVWTELATSLRAVATRPPADPEFRYETTFEPGTGAWLLLTAAVVALVAIGLLLVPARRPVYPPPGWQAPPPTPPPWPAAPPWTGPPRA